MESIQETFQDNAAPSGERLNRQLIIAVWKGEYSQIRDLVQRGANPDARRGPQSRTLLMNACENGDVATVRVLLSNGAHAAQRDDDMDTCLHLAAASDRPELMDILFAKGANTESVNKSRYTPLMVAAAAGKPANIERLIALGANPNATTKSGLSALHLATMTGDAKTVSLLLQNGANPQAEADKKLTPLSIAKRINDPDVMEAYIRHFSLQHSRKVYAVHKNRARMLCPA